MGCLTGRWCVLAEVLAAACGCAAVPTVFDPASAGIQPDPLPAHPEKGPFLFCYFLGNGDGLHLAASQDGLQFAPVGGANKIFLTPTIVNEETGAQVSQG